MKKNNNISRKALTSPRIVDNSESAMSNQAEFDPKEWSAAALRLIMMRVQQWGCTPAEAVRRLLDEVAQNSNKEAA